MCFSNICTLPRMALGICDKMAPSLDLPGGPAVKNPPANAEDTSPILGPWFGKISHAAEQLSPCTTNYWSLCALEPRNCNKERPPLTTTSKSSQAARPSAIKNKSVHKNVSFFHFEHHLPLPSATPAKPLWPVNTQVTKILPSRLFCPWDSPGKNTGVGSHFLLQGIFLTQGSNPGLLHCRSILYSLSHQGSPNWNLHRTVITLRLAFSILSE